ncbi:protein TALPID3 isoform X2 [Gambusia affinis]|uniref:protein TALPID3 isoform X2 n=1 Tax=Gambusia affinis TaxID=33528 RepID=UPI001CDBB11B|nr:protein TALPID3 isoform X2 [Gambusia affinis]
MLSPAPFDSTAFSPGQLSCSSDTGEVLIRSTRIALPERRLEASEVPQSVQITVQKLGEPVRVQSHRTKETQRPRNPGHKPEVVDPARVAKDSQTGPLAPSFSSGQELQTSCFKAGGRGVVLGALRQRCHSNHHKREVSVQLLRPRSTPNTSNGWNSPDQNTDDAASVSGFQTEASSGRLGDISKTAAAAAAAAVAAAAPLIKAQSDIEARMSQLSEGLQKLLHTDREDDGRRRSLSQHTLHRLETLQSQQLQLQSQLLESAIKIVTGQDSIASDSRAKVQDQKPSSPGTGGPAIAPAVIPTDAVAMETCHCDSRPEQSRSNLYLQQRPADPVAESVHLQSLAKDTQEAVRRASEMLKQMECLKTEIKMLLTQEDSPGCLQAQQSQPEPLQSRSKPKEVHVQFHENQHYQSNPVQHQTRPSSLQPTDHQNTHPPFQASHAPHRQSQENMGPQLQSQCNQNLMPITTSPQAGPLLTHHSLAQEVQGPSSQSFQAHSHQSQFSLLQRKPGGSSTLEEAGQVLRQARRRKKVLENNLEALLKANHGEILHCQLEALAANRDLTEEVRIKKTVDAWINTLTTEVQTQGHPPPPQGAMPPLDAGHCRAANATKPQQRAAGRGKPVSMPRRMTNQPVMGRGGRGQTAAHRMEAEPAGVSGNLMGSQQNDMDGELYLTRLYGRLPHEGLRRTLKKSPYPRFSSPVSPLGRKQHPRLVESIRGVRLKSCKTQTGFAPVLSLSVGQASQHSHLSLHHSARPVVNSAERSTAARAIPLRLPRCERVQDRASVLPVPLSRSKANVNDGANNHQKQQVVVEKPPPSPSHVTEIKAAEPLKDDEDEENSFPGNNFLSVTDVHQKQQVVPEKPPSSPSRVIEIKAAEPLKDDEDEENSFPGNNFLSVADVHQEENSDVGEEVVVLEGGPSPAPVRYHTPAFPPEAPSSRRAEIVTPVVGGGRTQDILENRLVEWVEQQLMSRMIADMYRPAPPDPAQNDSTDQSELEEQSFTSDIVEAAGGGGLQLFVDANVSVDSALIRQLVNEVLTETVAQMLSQTSAVAMAPEPQPEAPQSGDTEDKVAPLVPTPAPSPPPSRPQLSRDSTPAATPLPSKPSSPVPQDSPQPVTAPEPVPTPAATPEPQLPDLSSSSAHQAPPPASQGNPQLSLDELEELESQKHPLPLSVAVEEPAVSSPAPVQSQPPQAEPSPAPPPSHLETSSSSSSSSSSCSSSSSTVTGETEAALKHISEGELLVSVNQLAPLTEEEEVCSFSSSLHEVEDMAFDSSTLEQVGGRSILLSLLTKMDQGVTHRGQRPQPEGSWGREEMEDEVSVGEVRDCGPAKPQNQTRDPAGLDQSAACGQISQPADVGHLDKQNPQGGARKTGVHLATCRAQDRNDEDNQGTDGSVDADTDSSTSDVF